MTSFFDRGSPYLSHPLLTATRSAAEVEKVLANAPEATSDVLDVGCGFGRHSIELARRGYCVVGIDPSEAMIDASRSGADEAGVDVEFVHVAGQDFDRADAFDLALVLFTTLGQLSLGDAAVDVSHAVLRSINTSLRPGGVVVIEVPERDRAREALVTEEQLGETMVTRSFDETTATLRERFETPTDTFELAYVLFSATELVEAVEGSGFVVRSVDPNGLVTPPMTNMVLVAECLPG